MKTPENGRLQPVNPTKSIRWMNSEGSRWVREKKVFFLEKRCEMGIFSPRRDHFTGTKELRELYLYIYAPINQLTHPKHLLQGSNLRLDGSETDAVVGELLGAVSVLHHQRAVEHAFFPAGKMLALSHGRQFSRQVLEPVPLRMQGVHGRFRFPDAVRDDRVLCAQGSQTSLQAQSKPWFKWHTGSRTGWGLRLIREVLPDVPDQLLKLPRHAHPSAQNIVHRPGRNQQQIRQVFRPCPEQLRRFAQGYHGCRL
jgi:hypothetical protein